MFKEKGTTRIMRHTLIINSTIKCYICEVDIGVSDRQLFKLLSFCSDLHFFACIT